MFPVTPSVGVALSADSVQKWPAVHEPTTAVSPTVSQYDPVVHGVHCPAVSSPVLAEKVPIGHGVVETPVPASQYCPAGQSAMWSPPVQYDPTSHVSHAEAPSDDMYDPSGHVVATADPASQKLPTGHRPVGGVAEVDPRTQ